MVPATTDRGGDMILRPDQTLAATAAPPDGALAVLAAQQKAMVEARFVIAYNQRRSWDAVRISLNRLCGNSEFAAEALYVKPIARTPDDWKEWSKREKLVHAPEDWPTGFSIRFVEAAIFEAHNMDVQNVVLSDTEDSRITLVVVMDLETNTAYSRMITTKKTIERRQLRRNQEALYTRTNSSGDTVYVVPATEAEVTMNEAAAVSKAIRTLGEKLLPPHLKAEWKRRLWETIKSEIDSDPEAAKKKVLDNFAHRGITPTMIEQYLGHPIDATQPSEYVTLRGIFVAIDNGEATWSDVVTGPPAEADDVTPGQRKILERINAQRKRGEDPAQGAAPKPQPQASQGQPAAPSQTVQERPEVKPEGKTQAEAQAAQEKPSQQPNAPQPKRSLVYSGVELPAADDVPVGTECLCEGDHLRVEVVDGFPAWMRVAKEEKSQAKPSGGRKRNVGALFEEEGNK